VWKKKTGGPRGFVLVFVFEGNAPPPKKKKKGRKTGGNKTTQGKAQSQRPNPPTPPPNNNCPKTKQGREPTLKKRGGFLSKTWGTKPKRTGKKPIKVWGQGPLFGAFCEKAKQTKRGEKQLWGTRGLFWFFKKKGSPLAKNPPAPKGGEQPGLKTNPEKNQKGFGLGGCGAAPFLWGTTGVKKITAHKRNPEFGSVKPVKGGGGKKGEGKVPTNPQKKLKKNNLFFRTQETELNGPKGETKQTKKKKVGGQEDGTPTIRDQNPPSEKKKKKTQVEKNKN